MTEREGTMTRKRMTVFDAVSLLAHVHTRAHDEAGYVVEMPMLDPSVSQMDYVEAWGVLRRKVGLETVPLSRKRDHTASMESAVPGYAARRASVRTNSNREPTNE